ncbi:MAG: ABC transporter permease [Planctomycetota bacterium]
MTVLNRKLRRQVRESRGLLASIVLILSIGVACLVGMLATWRNLDRALDDYYARCRMADFWVDLDRAPVPDLREACAVDGVAEVRDRLQFPVTVEGLDGERQVEGLALSLPAAPHPVLCGVQLVRGHWFDGESRDEVIVSDKFAEARGLGPGDEVDLVLDGRQERFRVVGTALSAEHVYLLPPGDLAPDPRHYGLFFLPRQRLAELIDREGAANSIVGRFTPEGAREPEAVLDDLARRLDDFGVFAAYPRADQPSHVAISSEMKQLRSFAVWLSTIFFSVAVLVLVVLMSRTVQRERTLIGTLLALGTPRRTLALHYVGLGLVVGLAGAAVGCVLGQWISSAVTTMYRGFFEFPALDPRLYPDLLALATACAAGCAGLGALVGMRAVFRLRPAEAMRPAPPERGGRVWLERVAWLWARLPARSRMVLRNLGRHPMRTSVGVLASALACAIVVLALGWVDVLDDMLAFQFDKVQRADVSLTLADERDRAAVDELRRLPGVLHAEGSSAVACVFEHGARRRRGAVQGIHRDAELTVPHDAAGARVPVPATGLLMTERLAAQLGVGEGDVLTVREVAGERRQVEARIARVVQTYIGMAVYADFDWLERALGRTGTVAQVDLATGRDPAERRALLAELRRRPGVQAVQETSFVQRRVEEEFLDLMYVFLGVYVLFAGAILLGTVLTVSWIAVAERQREIATLRAIGWRAREVARSFLLESLAVTLAGAVPGLLLGQGLMDLMARSFQNDLFSMPSRIAGATFVHALGLAVLFVLVAHALVGRSIRRLSWVAELGAKE